MNKLLTSIAAAGMLAISYSTSANSIELPEVRLGATHTESVVYGSVAETRANGRDNKQKGLFLNDSVGIFGELAIKQLFGLTIGFEYGGDGVSNTAERIVAKRATMTAASGATAEETRNGTQKVDLSIDDSTSVYLLMPIMDTGFFVKAGQFETDIITKETLFTGSTYGNVSMSADFVGLGYQHNVSDLFFVRAEGQYMEFDAASVTGSGEGDVISLSDVGQASAKFSVGLRY
jgi:hypothetical protein